MPKIQSITVADNLIQFTDKRGTHTINASDIPVAQNTIAKVENWLNTTGLPALSDGEYQMKVRVISINPLQVKLMTANMDSVIPSDWATRQD